MPFVQRFSATGGRSGFDRKEDRRQRIAIDIREFGVDLLGVEQSRRVDQVQLVITAGAGKKDGVIRGEDSRHGRQRMCRLAVTLLSVPGALPR